MTAIFSISMEYFGRFQIRASTDAGFRVFQLFTTSSRRDTNSKDRYRPNRRVVEHKGLLRVFGSSWLILCVSERFHRARILPICARSCTPLSRASAAEAYGL